MGRKTRQRAAAAKQRAPVQATVPVWYHPQHGVIIRPERPGPWRSPGMPVIPWSEVCRLDIVERSAWDFTIVPGQSLPRGYLWGTPSQQTFGMGGPHLAYAPIERRCTDCKEMFVWPAKAQQHMFETLRVGNEKTARRCQPCARKRLALEQARVAYAAGLAELRATPTSAQHVRVAKLMLAVLEAGGRLSIDRAIGYCTRARKLGAAASVDAVEAKLRALRSALP